MCFGVAVLVFATPARCLKAVQSNQQTPRVQLLWIQKLKITEVGAAF